MKNVEYLLNKVKKIIKCLEAEVGLFHRVGLDFCYFYVYRVRLVVARKGKNRPKTILPRLLGEEERKIISFETGEEFEKEWKRLTEKGLSKTQGSANSKEDV